MSIMTNPAPLTTAQLDELTTLFGTRLLMPGDNGWAEAVRLWNGMIDTLPAAVVRPESVADVRAAVRFAGERGVSLGIKGGGHNIAGTAIAAGGLLLDMSGLREITVDPQVRLANVGPGALLRDVDRATQEHGLATVLGFISEVGVAGLTLGGGLGYLTRRFGWTVDNLEEVEIVTANGEVCTASRDEYPELFWAVRGAGANMGVVTRFTFRLHAVGPIVHGGLVAWPFERVGEVLQAYHRLTTDAPRELAVWLVLMTAPPAPFVPEEWQGRKICSMVVCYTGDPARALEALEPIRAIGSPIIDLLAEQPYTEIQSYFDDGEPKGMHYYWKTGYAAQLSDALLDTLRDVFAHCPVPDAEIGILQVGGAVNDHEEDDGAVGNRDAHYVIGVNGMWEPDEPRAAEFCQWIRDAFARLSGFTTGRSYINFQSSDEGRDQVRSTYGTNFDRLLEIKRRYDPENLFHTNRNVRGTDRSTP